MKKNIPKDNDSNFHVCVRIRPTSNPSFYSGGHQEGIKYIRGGPENSILLVQPYTTQGDKVFIYDEVFDQNSNTKDIFEKVVLPNISDSLFKGFSHTILVYGMTGSGKTFTMFGDNCAEPQTVVLSLAGGNDIANNGTIIRGSGNAEGLEVDGPLKNDQSEALKNDCKGGIVSETVKFVLARHSESSKIKLKMSYLEIYNESVRDLLSTDTSTADNLMILEDPEKGVHCPLLCEKDITNLDQISFLIRQGNKRRMMASTKLNQFSSRSHAIIQLSIEMEIENNGQMTTFLTPKLYMVDLAGSERAAATESKGIRLKEGGNINKSLLSLGNCITVLSSQGNDKRKKHVPYRDSKLTRLLKESLGGNAKTLFIGCVTPAFRFVEETINTLSYAQRAKSIHKEVYENVKQIYNAIEKEEQVKVMHESIETLKELLQNSTNNGRITDMVKEDSLTVTDEELLQRLQGISTEQTNPTGGVEVKQFKTQFEIFQEKFAELSDHFEDILFRSRELESNLEEYNESREQNERLVHEIMDTINPAALDQKDMKYRLDKVNMLRGIIKHNEEVIEKLHKELSDNDDMKIIIKKELESLYEVKFIAECQQLSNFQLYSSFEKEKKRLQETINQLHFSRIREAEEDKLKETLVAKLEDELSYLKNKVNRNEAILEENNELIQQKNCSKGKGQINLRSSMFVGGNKVTPRSQVANNNLTQVTSKYMQFQSFVPSSNISVNTVKEKSANLRNSMYNPTISTRNDLEQHDNLGQNYKSIVDIHTHNTLTAEECSPSSKEYEEYKRKEHIIETQLKSVSKMNNYKINSNMLSDTSSQQQPSHRYSNSKTSFKSSFLETLQPASCFEAPNSSEIISSKQSLSKQDYLRRSELTPQEYQKVLSSESTSNYSVYGDKSQEINNINDQAKMSSFKDESQKNSFVSPSGGVRGSSPSLVQGKNNEKQKSYNTTMGSIGYSSFQQQQKPQAKTHSKNTSYQGFDGNSSLSSSNGTNLKYSQFGSSSVYDPQQQQYSINVISNNNVSSLTSTPNPQKQLAKEESNFAYKSTLYSTPNSSTNKLGISSSVSPISLTPETTIGLASKNSNTITSTTAQTLNTFQAQKTQSAYKVNSISTVYSTDATNNKSSYNQPLSFQSPNSQIQEMPTSYIQTLPQKQSSSQSSSQKSLKSTSFNNYQQNNTSYGIVNPSNPQGSPTNSYQQGAQKILQVPTTAISLNFDSK